MCNRGSMVYHDCTGDFSTTCIPCSPGTFVSEPNGLYQCFPCRQCAESQGLYIQSKCTTVRDTICDALDGYRCVRFSNSECLHAEKHRVCKPGQETKTFCIGVFLIFSVSVSACRDKGIRYRMVLFSIRAELHQMDRLCSQK